MVISVFDSVAKAIAAHDSPAYQAAVNVLGDGAERDVRIVEGLELGLSVDNTLHLQHCTLRKKR